MGSTNLFNLHQKTYTRSKNLTVRVPPARRQRLDLIASEQHWQLSEMVNNMIENFIEEYEKRPKAQQAKFDFAG